jgi:hypothetical protein
MNIKIVESKLNHAAEPLGLSGAEGAILRQILRSEKATYWPALVEKYGNSGKVNYTDFHSRLTIVMASLCLTDTTTDIVNLIKQI